MRIQTTDGREVSVGIRHTKHGQGVEVRYRKDKYSRREKHICRMTTCFLSCDGLDADGTKVHDAINIEGRAICSPLDQFSYSQGRREARKKFMEVFEKRNYRVLFTRQDRTKIFKLIYPEFHTKAKASRRQQRAAKIEAVRKALSLDVPAFFGSAPGMGEAVSKNGHQDLCGPITKRPSLDEALSKVTSDNIHAEVDFGPEVGNEVVI